jgi:hypothetical protein
VIVWDVIVRIAVKCLVMTVDRFQTIISVVPVDSDPDPAGQLVTDGSQEVEVIVTTFVSVMVTTSSPVATFPLETSALALTVVVVTKSVSVEVVGITTVCVGSPVGKV